MCRGCGGNEWCAGDESPRDVVWEHPADPPVDLNARLVPPRPDVALYTASSISASGRIAAFGWSITNADVEGYLLTPRACPR